MVATWKTEGRGTYEAVHGGIDESSNAFFFYAADNLKGPTIPARWSNVE
jgi:hypothetical protein